VIQGLKMEFKEFKTIKKKKDENDPIGIKLCSFPNSDTTLKVPSLLSRGLLNNVFLKQYENIVFPKEPLPHVFSFCQNVFKPVPSVMFDISSICLYFIYGQFPFFKNSQIFFSALEKNYLYMLDGRFVGQGDELLNGFSIVDTRILKYILEDIVLRTAFILNRHLFSFGLMKHIHFDPTIDAHKHKITDPSEGIIARAYSTKHFLSSFLGTSWKTNGSKFVGGKMRIHEDYYLLSIFSICDIHFVEPFPNNAFFDADLSLNDFNKIISILTPPASDDIDTFHSKDILDQIRSEQKKDERETEAFKIGKDIDLLEIENIHQSDSGIKECGEDSFLKNLDFYSQNRFYLMNAFWDYYFRRVCEWAETFSHEHNYYHKNRIKYLEALDVVSENQFVIGSMKYSDHIYNLFESDFKTYLRTELYKRKTRLGLTKHGTESDYLLAQFLPVIYSEYKGFYVTVSDFCYFNCIEPCYIFLVPSQTGLFPICEPLTPFSCKSRRLDPSNIDSYCFSSRYRKFFPYFWSKREYLAYLRKLRLPPTGHISKKLLLILQFLLGLHPYKESLISPYAGSSVVFQENVVSFCSIPSIVREISLFCPLVYNKDGISHSHKLRCYSTDSLMLGSFTVFYSDVYILSTFYNIFENYCLYYFSNQVVDLVNKFHKKKRLNALSDISFSLLPKKAKDIVIRYKLKNSNFTSSDFLPSFPDFFF